MKKYWQRMAASGVLGVLAAGVAMAAPPTYTVTASGQIVGATNPTNAVLWEDGNVYQVSQLIAAEDPHASNLALFSATGINAAGQIVSRGYSTLTPGTTAQGSAYLLSPVSSEFTLTAPTTVTAGESLSVTWKVPANRVGHEGDWVGFTDGEYHSIASSQLTVTP